MRPPHKQQGMALIMLVFIVALAATGYLLHALDPVVVKIERDKKTATALAEAKSALIGWSVAHAQYPGILPFPDRSINDKNYDGNSDCVNGVNYVYLIGKLPYVGQTQPCVGDGATLFGISANLEDGYGEKLWYAVSKNLIRTSKAQNLVINPSTLNDSLTWMIVRDKYGRVISERVAAVIIAPGPVIGTQNRAGGLAGPAEYLDSVIISGERYSNANYNFDNEDFIIGEDIQNVRLGETLYQQPYQFNDRLTYITIDELMTALQKRVIREVSAQLRTYYKKSSANPAARFFPYAASMGTGNVCEEGRLQGAIPISNSASACSHASTGTGLSGLPAWFTENRWQDYFYYALSGNCSHASPGCATGNITAGTQTNIDVLLIATGPALATQSRPSSAAADYLDSIENADGDFVFNALNTPMTDVYNDQMLVVAKP